MTLYTHLRPDHIRLLRLTDSTGLNAVISEHSVQHAPAYACLSYLWGEEDAHPDVDGAPHVMVDSHGVRIQRNLYDALTTLAESVFAEGLYLWVDRICIDQSNLNERAQQVKLMKRLYEQAGKILAWTGSSGLEADRLAVLMLSTVGAFSRQALNSRTRPTLDWMLGLIRSGLHFQDASTELILTAWAAVIALLKRPYWSRTWIHQEATLPKVTFFCGSHRFTWKELQAANEFHGTYGGFRYLSNDYLLIWSNGVSIGSPVLDLVVAYENRCQILDGSRPRVATSTTLVRQLRQANCHDARDKIFAMLPHATDIVLQHQDPLLSVDYNKPIFDVYLDFAEYCIRSGRGLEILGIRGFIFDTITKVVSTSGRQEIPVSNVLVTWLPELVHTYGALEKSRFFKLVLADAYQTEHEETGITANARGGESFRDFIDQDPTSLPESSVWIRSQLHHALHGVCRDRRAGYTEGRRLGIFPEAASPGDLVAAFHGGNTLYVVRTTGDEGKYTFVGECYVEDMMDGQVMTLAEQKGIVPHTLCLV